MRMKKNTAKDGMGPGQKKKDCFGSRATSTQKTAWARDERRKASARLRQTTEEWRTAV
jgi:hypothetical protein